MKKIAFIIIVLSLAFPMFSQIIEGNDGLFYTEQNNLYSGLYTEFFENGQKRIELNLVDGKRDGEVILYFKSGEKNEIRKYKMNLMHGTWTTWNEQSVKIAEANYNNGKKNGKWFIWDENGTLRYNMTYKDGKKTG
ncbi:MAG: toxin-antitoxin system YwqK family antitoxin, partial [Bacteroidota bacterium]|nr:toxin-antitoxin system YwqK family antitoxin [Bacteroidota bacterium]